MLNPIQSHVPAVSSRYPESITTTEQPIAGPTPFPMETDAVSLSQPEPDAGLLHFINRIEGELGRVMDRQAIGKTGPYRAKTSPASIAGRFLRALENRLFGEAPAGPTASSGTAAGGVETGSGPVSRSEATGASLPAATKPAISPSTSGNEWAGRLEQGVDRGYSQTRGDFSGAEHFQEIMDAVDQAYGLIKQGVQDIKTRTAGADSGSYSYSTMAFDESRNLSLTIMTRDGDRVSIDIHQTAGAGQSQFAAAGSDGGTMRTEQYGYLEKNLAYSIRGDLDEDEITAIRELIGDIAGLAKTFYAFDMGKTISQAASIDFDSTELSGFSLDMDVQQTRYAAVLENRAYSGEERHQGTGSNAIPADMLDQFRLGMERTNRLLKDPALGRIENPRRLIRDLFEALGKHFEKSSFPPHVFPA
ncbi:MAG: hypothetical protein ACOZF0_14315 [Thermodesulfobacteriota bacterium]